MKRIESTQNSLVKHWKKLVLTRKERDKSGEFLVEGFHLVEEALKNKGAILALIVREDVKLPSSWKLEGIHLVEVPSTVAKEFSETEHTQGIYAHCRQPVHSEGNYPKWSKLLLIDSVQDPGNVGTMIRTADAAGIDAVILGKGTADAYNPKTVRSGQGSHFNIPVIRGDLMEWVQKLQIEGVQVLGTGLENAISYTDAKIEDGFALLVGNEGSGVDPELLSVANQTVMIPLRGKAESLNVAVATGILLYAYSK